MYTYIQYMYLFYMNIDMLLVALVLFQLTASLVFFITYVPTMCLYMYMLPRIDVAGKNTYSRARTVNLRSGHDHQ